jgi:hypothetical protein
MSINKEQDAVSTFGSYEVGNCNPPKHSQFQKGKSGNPKGRPKDVKNASTVLTEMFATPVTVSVNGKPKKMPFSEIMGHKLKAAVMGGDLKALKLAFDMYAKSGSIFDTPATGGSTTGQTAFDLTAEEYEVITKSKLLKGVE